MKNKHLGLDPHPTHISTSRTCLHCYGPYRSPPPALLAPLKCHISARALDAFFFTPTAAFVLSGDLFVDPLGDFNLGSDSIALVRCLYPGHLARYLSMDLSIPRGEWSRTPCWFRQAHPGVRPLNDFDGLQVNGLAGNDATPKLRQDLGNIPATCWPVRSHHVHVSQKLHRSTSSLQYAHTLTFSLREKNMQCATACAHAVSDWQD